MYEMADELRLRDGDVQLIGGYQGMVRGRKEYNSKWLSSLCPGRWGKVDPWSGPCWKEKMQVALSTHSHGTLVPSRPEDDTHPTMSFLTKMPFITLQEWRCRLP